MAPKVLSPSGHNCSWVRGSGCLMPTRKTVASYLQVILTLPNELQSKVVVEALKGINSGLSFSFQKRLLVSCWLLINAVMSWGVMSLTYLKLLFFHQKEPKSGVTLWITSLHGCFAAPEVGPWAMTTFLGHIHKRKETSPISEAPWAVLPSQYLLSERTWHFYFTTVSALLLTTVPGACSGVLTARRSQWQGERRALLRPECLCSLKIHVLKLEPPRWW